MKKKSGQNDDFNPFKSAPKAERANITARANNTAPMVRLLFTYGIRFQIRIRPKVWIFADPVPDLDPQHWVICRVTAPDPKLFDL